MRKFFLTISVGLALVAGFNFWADPANHWHEKQFRPQANWKADQCWVSPDNFDERLLRRDQLKFIDQHPDFLFLGTSRVFLVSNEMFKPDVKIFNAGVSSAMAEDFVSLWQEISELGKYPRFLVIFIDPWILNPQTKNMRWKTNWDLYRKFVDQHLKSLASTTSLNDSKFLVLEKVRTLLSQDLAELLSWRVLVQSIRIVPKRLHPDQPDNLIVPIAAADQLNREHLCWKADGSLMYGARTRAIKTLAEIREIGRQYTAASLKDHFVGEFDHHAIDLLKSLLEDAKAKGVHTLIFSPPYHHSVTRVYAADTSLRQANDRFQAALKALPAEAYCSIPSPDAVGCSEQEFIDAQHSQSSCTKKFLAECLKQAGWQEFLAH